MTLLPPSFLVRICYPCDYVKGIPHEEEDDLLDLPEGCRLENFAGMDHDLFAVDPELQRAVEDIGELLVVMAVFGNNAAFFE